MTGGAGDTDDTRRRLNLHLRVKDSLLDWVLAANAAVSAISPSIIAFGPDRAEVPHVTLLMGRVGGDFDDAEFWSAALAESAVLPLTLHFGRPYVAAGHYAMCDLLPNADMERLRNRLNTMFGCPQDDEAPGRLSVSEKYGSATHLTLAYVDGCADLGAVMAALDALPDPPAFRAGTLELSEAGKHGTCMRPFRWGCWN